MELKDLTTDEIKEFSKIRDEQVNLYKQNNLISNILVISIGSNCNKAISKMERISNVSTLLTDTKSEWLADFGDYNCLSLVKNNTDSLWEMDKDKLFSEIKNIKTNLVEQVNKFDYIIICTESDNNEYSYSAEYIADICSKENIRFMICYTKNNEMIDFINFEEISKKKTEDFIARIKKKNYILNEIASSKSYVHIDNCNFRYKSKKFTTQICTQKTNFNEKLFTFIITENIKAILKGV